MKITITNKDYQRLNFLSGYMIGVTDPTFTKGLGHVEALEMFDIIRDMKVEE